MPAMPETLVHCVNVTTARNLSPLFDEAVRRERPVLIVRGRREVGVLVSRATTLRLLAPYRVQVDVLPNDEEGSTLWVRELNVGGTGPTPLAARADLVSAIRAHILDYWEQFDFYRHLPEMTAQEPYVLRLSLAQDNAELVELLFGGQVSSAE